MRMPAVSACWSPCSGPHDRSEEHTSELQSLMRISYALFCLKKKKYKHQTRTNNRQKSKDHKQTRTRKKTQALILTNSRNSKQNHISREKKTTTQPQMSQILHMCTALKKDK